MHKRTLPLMLKISIFVSFVLFCFAPARADTIYLKNGGSQEGIIKSEGSKSIEVEVNGGVIKLPKEDVSWIVKSSDAVRRQLREKWGLDKSTAENITGKQVQFKRGQQGMVVNAVINGNINVKLILDTGASLVVLRKGLAEALGIDAANLKSDMKTILADGKQSGAKHIVLRSVRVEGSEVASVDALILVEDAGQDLLEDGLLGDSFLRNFNYRIDQKENKLILEKIR
ncbi:MAG: retropepsin-like aspartic protease [Candidatus Omnitrophica bacterium]|nr:retropepsin-like aspartic protease [Candidatus Omnitrophota bacterium]